MARRSKSRRIEKVKGGGPSSGSLNPGRGPTSSTVRGGTVVSSGLGLCSTCESAPLCKIPKPEGGVWHCEFYR
jgi:hypothetical protein